MLPVQRRLESLLNQPLPGPRDRVDAGFQRRGNFAVAPARAGIRCIRFQQDARLQHLPGSPLPGTDQGAEPFPLLVAERYNVFLHGGLSRSHASSPALPERSNQKFAAKSRTRGASAGAAPSRTAAVAARMV